MDVGILGYGIYIPKYSIQISEIAHVWGKRPQDIIKSLGVREKAIASQDEDAVTIGLEASFHALKHAKISSSSIEACFVGSESHPYAVNPTSTIIAEFLNIGNNYLATDLEFACKAGTSGIIMASGLVQSGEIKHALVVGTDKAQAKPHDILEYTASSGSAAYIIGKDASRIASILAYTSFSSDTPDFWRRDGVRYPSHGGRFTGEPAYYTHVIASAKQLLHKTGKKPEDFTHCVFHMPNGKFPREVAKRLGFLPHQLAQSLTVDYIGNPYSASSLIGLASVLDAAKPGEDIFLVSYGSGAGSDAFFIHVEQGIEKKRSVVVPVSSFLKERQYISYVDYLRKSKKI